MDFQQRYGPWAVIAGASEGVGAFAARQLGEQGINVVLVSRRKAVLDEVAATVASETRTVALDLSEPDAWRKLADATSDIEVGLLIYNAGAEPPCRLFDKSLDDWQKLIARNCSTVLGATYHYASSMVQRGRGGIVIVGSNGGWAGSANLAVYGGTKAFDLIFAESLWAELRPAGVDVLAMVLGATATPAFLRLIDGRTHEGMADSEEVARTMLANLAEGPTCPPGAAQFGSVDRRVAVEERSRAVLGHFGSD